MVLDATWFGYGAGLVMCGWFAGMVCKIALDAFRRV